MVERRFHEPDVPSSSLGDGTKKKGESIINKDKTNYETSKHIRMVSKLLGNILKELVDRSNLHDQSKLESPEDKIFAKYTPILADLTYGSEEYYETLKKM